MSHPGVPWRSSKFTVVSKTWSSHARLQRSTRGGTLVARGSWRCHEEELLPFLQQLSMKDACCPWISRFSEDLNMGGKYPETKYSMHARTQFPTASAVEGTSQVQCSGGKLNQHTDLSHSGWSTTEVLSAFLPNFWWPYLHSFIGASEATFQKTNNDIILSLQGRRVKSAIHLVPCMWEEEAFKPSTQNVDSCL